MPWLSAAAMVCLAASLWALIFKFDVHCSNKRRREFWLAVSTQGQLLAIVFLALTEGSLPFIVMSIVTASMTTWLGAITTE